MQLAKGSHQWNIVPDFVDLPLTFQSCLNSPAPKVREIEPLADPDPQLNLPEVTKRKGWQNRLMRENSPPSLSPSHTVTKGCREYRYIYLYRGKKPVYIDPVGTSLFFALQNRILSIYRLSSFLSVLYGTYSSLVDKPVESKGIDSAHPIIKGL